MIVLYEFFVERFLIQKDPWISEFFVESIFSLLHALHYTCDITITREDNKGSVGSPLERVHGFFGVIIFIGYGVLEGLIAASKF